MQLLMFLFVFIVMLIVAGMCFWRGLFFSGLVVVLCGCTHHVSTQTCTKPGKSVLKYVMCPKSKIIHPWGVPTTHPLGYKPIRH